MVRICIHSVDRSRAYTPLGLAFDLGYLGDLTSKIFPAHGQWKSCRCPQPYSITSTICCTCFTANTSLCCTCFTANTSCLILIMLHMFALETLHVVMHYFTNVVRILIAHAVLRHYVLHNLIKLCLCFGKYIRMQSTTLIML